MSYTLTVNGWTGCTGSGTYPDGKIVEVTPGTLPPNRTFAEWGGANSGNLLDPVTYSTNHFKSLVPGNFAINAGYDIDGKVHFCCP